MDRAPPELADEEAGDWRRETAMSEENAARELASLRALPKAEVHVHLEGAFDPLTLEKWSAEAGVAMPRPRERRFKFQGLAAFLRFFDWACGLVNSGVRLEEMAYGFCRRLAADGTRYADVIVNPTHWHAWHGRIRDLIDALDRGFAAAE